MKTTLLDPSKGEKRPAMIACPKCGKENLMKLSPFEADMSDIISDKCQSCGVDLHVCVFLLANTDRKKLALTMKMVVDMLATSSEPAIIH